LLNIKKAKVPPGSVWQCTFLHRDLLVANEGKK